MKGRWLPGAAWVMLLLLLQLPLSENVCRGAETEGAGSSYAEVQGEDEAVPSYYNSREEGRSPKVRSQGTHFTCWALCAVSALEAALLPEEHVYFDAGHLISENGFLRSEDEGGDIQMIMAYLSAGKGPLEEAAAENGDAPSHIVRDVRFLYQSSQEEIKRAVRECGSVQTSLYMNRNVIADGNYYNPDSFAYYYDGTEKVDHDILIIGWDDDFPGEAFGRNPGRDGAWICQNTWGTDFGDEGLFYVSYEDAQCGKRALCYSRITPPAEGEIILQNDELGWQGRVGYGSETCYFANVYETEEDMCLSGVVFYSAGEDSSFEVYYVPWFQDTASFVGMERIAEGTLPQRGYYTIETDSGPLVRGGRPFAVVVKITTPGEKRPVIVEYRRDESTRGVTTEGREGYISPDGDIWENIEEKYQANVCLKAVMVPAEHSEEETK